MTVKTDLDARLAAATAYFKGTPVATGVTGSVALAAQEANKPENIAETQRQVQNAAIKSSDAQVRKSTK